MYKVKVNKIEKVRHQATGSDFLDVSFDIIEVMQETSPSGEVNSTSVVRESRKLAFDPRIKSDDFCPQGCEESCEHELVPGLKSELQKVCDAYALEQVQIEKQRTLDKVDENVTTLSEELTGVEFEAKDK